mmetsp:Transcript_126063/g.356460  ORF Transcript_126063/g.356460 Transcript_126063/m.356460 type:complete len:352 (+) Transcript_126063:81-1136(+)
MARWAAAAAGFSALVLGAGASVALPPDNSFARFREDPDQFGKIWRPAPKKMNGEAPGEWDSDVLVHSSDPAERRLWADYLYPVGSEVRFSGAPVSLFCRRHWWVGYAAVSMYVLALCWGTEYMGKREPFKLKAPLALWNLLLAVFSLLGALRVGSHLALLLGTYGFEYTVCRPPQLSYMNGAAGLWTALFIFSKYFELLDTAFLVWRKRKVEFLHWYHHCSVLLYCWNAYVWEMPTGIYFIVMNYSVHAIMYSYYFLACVCKRPPRWALMVTILQLTQMAVGIGITVTHIQMLAYDTVPNCDGHVPNLMAALMMYASYFVLFAQFLFRRYCVRRDPAASKVPGKLPSMKLD